jgi:hypothetical protein
MSTVLTDRGAIHLGLDVHKNTISVGILEPDAEVPVVDKISSDEDSVRRLIGRFDQPSRLRACYEADPTGYQLARLLGSLHVRCEVIAPSLIPSAPGRSGSTGRRNRRSSRLIGPMTASSVRVCTMLVPAAQDKSQAGGSSARTSRVRPSARSRSAPATAPAAAPRGRPDPAARKRHRSLPPALPAVRSINGETSIQHVVPSDELRQQDPLPGHPKRQARPADAPGSERSASPCRPGARASYAPTAARRWIPERGARARHA